VTLTWLPAFDLTNVLYLLYQDEINIANTTSLYFLLFNLPTGEYHFYIKAIDNLGHISASSSVIPVQIGLTTTPPDPLWIIIIIAIGAAIGVVAGIFSYRKGVGEFKPRQMPKEHVTAEKKSKEKPTWITKALGYSPEFEHKLLALRTDPKKIIQVEDQELAQFLKARFTLLAPDLITKLEQLPISEEERTELLNTLLILPSERRTKVLDEFLEDLQEAPS
jgi:hypothetical protein